MNKGVNKGVNCSRDIYRVETTETKLADAKPEETRSEVRVGIAGAGKAGCSVGMFIKNRCCDFDLPDGRRLELYGYYSLHKSSAEDAAKKTGSRCLSSIKELLSETDLCIITVPDGQIGEVWKDIRTCDIKGKIIMHMSGSLAASVFDGIEATGAYGYSLHPMYAISSKYESWQGFSDAFFSLEGDDTYMVYIKTYVEELTGGCVCIDGSSKALYHGASVFASNLVVGLFETASEMLVKCGFNKEQAAKALGPLFTGNAMKIAELGTEAALTGPVERNDIATVEKHLAVLSADERQIYTSLSEKILKVAERKNPDRDYSELGRLLKKLS